MSRSQRNSTDGSPPTRPTGLQLAVQFGLLAVLVCAIPSSAAVLLEGKFGFEKTLTSLVMPVGAAWVLLTALALQSWITGNTAFKRWSWTVASLALWLLATAPLPNFLFRQLEKPLANEFDPDRDPPLDLLVVFGGGSSMGPTRPQVTDAGDRVMYAAQLFQKGKTTSLLTTGDQGSHQTASIWNELGLPSDRIYLIDGKNTFEEIQNLKSFLQTHPHARVGAVSSAYHLRRVLRLAKANGLQPLIPVAADYRSTVGKLTCRDFIPSISSLDKFSDVQREWMGWLIGR